MVIAVAQGKHLSFGFDDLLTGGAGPDLVIGGQGQDYCLDTTDLNAIIYLAGGFWQTGALPAEAYPC